MKEKEKRFQDEDKYFVVSNLDRELGPFPFMQMTETKELFELSRDGIEGSFKLQESLELIFLDNRKTIIASNSMKLSCSKLSSEETSWFRLFCVHTLHKIFCCSYSL